MLLHGDVDFRSTNDTKILVSLLNAKAHSWLYGDESKLETLLRGNVDFHSTNEVEVLIVVSV